MGEAECGGERKEKRKSEHMRRGQKERKQKKTIAAKNAEKIEPLCRIVKWCNHYGSVWRFIKIPKVELLYNPIIPLMTIYHIFMYPFTN